MEIYLIRHTRPAVPEGLCYGRNDVALDEADFAARLPQIAALLPEGTPLYSSPASRCARLADLLINGGEAPLQIDHRLHEMDFGDWEGRLWKELPVEETERWTSDIVRYSPPNGENFMAMWDRVTAFYEETVTQALRDGVPRLGLVGHAGSLKVILLRALGMAPRQFGVLDLAQGRVARLDVQLDKEGRRFEKLMFLNR